MTRYYKLKKDLPTFNGGDRFELREDGCLYFVDGGHEPDSPHWKTEVMAYHRRTLERFSNILADWFMEIPEERMRTPKIGETYFCLESEGRVWRDTWNGTPTDKAVSQMGNCFLSEDEALKARDWLEAFNTLRHDAKGFKPKWLVNNYNNKILRGMKDGLKECYVVVWRAGGIEINSALAYTSSIIFFETAEAAERSIKEHQKEWLTFFGIEGRSENA